MKNEIVGNKNDMKLMIDNNKVELKAYLEDKIITAREDMTKMVEANKKHLSNKININENRI